MTFQRTIKRRYITVEEREEYSEQLTVPNRSYWVAELDGPSDDGAEHFVAQASGTAPSVAVSALESKLHRLGITVTG